MGCCSGKLLLRSCCSGLFVDVEIFKIQIQRIFSLVDMFVRAHSLFRLKNSTRRQINGRTFQNRKFSWAYCGSGFCRHDVRKCSKSICSMDCEYFFSARRRKAIITFVFRKVEVNRLGYAIGQVQRMKKDI